MQRTHPMYSTKEFVNTNPQVNLNVLSNAYATRWYITLFAGNVVPHHTVLRIWDLMMLHGFDVLYFVAIAVLQYHQGNK